MSRTEGALGRVQSRILLAIIVVACVACESRDGRPRPAPYAIALRIPEDGLFAGEEMQLELTLTAPPIDGSTTPAVPVRYARVECTIDMPSMPGMPAFKDLAHAEGVIGDYGVHPTFQHGGDYRLRVRVLPASEQLPAMTPPPRGEWVSEHELSVADQPPSQRRSRAPGAQRYKLALTTRPEKPRAGEPAELMITMLENTARPEPTPEGGVRVTGVSRPVTEFDPSHERLLHLFVLRDDLGTFAHEHPVLGERGVFTLPYTFPSGGTYVVFADAAPRGAGSQVVATRLGVDGAEVAKFDLAEAARADRGMRRSADGLTIAWSLPSDPLPVGRSVRLTARLTDAAGAPVTDLEPYLGALGHLMLVKEGGGAFVHAHPDELRGKVQDGSIDFLARLPESGLYRGWAQVQRAGVLSTFDFVVAGAEGAG